jgi:hypothetical protein
VFSIIDFLSIQKRSNKTFNEPPNDNSIWNFAKAILLLLTLNFNLTFNCFDSSQSLQRKTILNEKQKAFRL